MFAGTIDKLLRKNELQPILPISADLKIFYIHGFSNSAGHDLTPAINMNMAVQVFSYAKNPNFSPFFLAKRIKACLCLASAPIDLQNSVITCECKAMAFPLNWLKGFFPMILRESTTRGANIPFPSFLFPITG